AARPPRRSGHFARPPVERGGRSDRLRCVHRGGDGERLVGDDDGGSAIGRASRIVGDDDRDGFPDGAHEAGGERGMAIGADGGRGNQRWHGASGGFGGGGGGEERDHSGQPAGRRGSD